MTVAEVAWDLRYPDQATLRREIDAMIGAVLDALFEAVPRHQIEGIYVKGSSRKTWQSPLDYVPEVSDIDIHVLFCDERAVACFDSIEVALTTAGCIEQFYRQRVAEPAHLPRPQVMVVNTFHRFPDFAPSPPSTVDTVYGQPYTASEIEPVRTRASARRQLLDAEPYLAELGMKVMDLPGKHIWPVLRGMSWRISPVGPRVLELLGVPYADAWSMNRTAVAERLQTLGQEQLAQDYATFYLRGWDFFRSRQQDGEAGRDMLLAGACVLAQGAVIARTG